MNRSKSIETKKILIQVNNHLKKSCLTQTNPFITTAKPRIQVIPHLTTKPT
jgi:hypothetical protein